MKIDRSKVKKSTSEVPSECKCIIERLKACCGNQDALLPELQQIKTWTFGKCELFHWADVLDMFDSVLEAACKKERDNQWLLPCDLPEEENLKQVLLQVLQFTSLLIEHSFTRHLYNSMEHLTTLLSSGDMTVVLAVLNLLYVFSKRSNFITRLSGDKKQLLVDRLTHLAESWGGKENGFGLAECCQDLEMSSYPPSATTLHFEFYADKKDSKVGQKSQSVLSSIHVDRVDKIPKLGAQVMEDLMQQYAVPESKQMLLLTHIRLAQAFSCYEKRIQCVQARLQAISVLVYSNAMQENVNTILYTGFIEELVDVLQVRNEQLMEIKAAALRTLTSVIHLDRNPKLQNIIDATGASSYHGFLPVLVRNCIEKMTDVNLDPFPQSFATALFSFLYHLASYECGGEALVSCGMMESLLKVINWLSEGQEHITFVTRAVRVVDLITNLGMQSFQAHAGLSAFINRLQHEVDVCRREQPYVIRPQRSESVQSMEGLPHSPHSPAATHDADSSSSSNPVPMETDTAATPPANVEALLKGDGKTCFPQRAALLKSMLNFLKKAIPDPAFSDSIRHLMDGYLPRSLKHIISNAEYYGPSLFLLATDVVTVYVFQEPSLLSSLQDNGLTDVVLHALLVKDVPPTREVLASLPNVFSALCLNARGLDAFVQCKPFDRLFKVLLSPDYLPAMRRRRSSDPPGDTASNLGSSMDELMRHQPSLKTEATKAIIMLLEEVCAMGRDSKYTCQKPLPKNEQATANIALRSQMANDGGSSEDDDEEEDDASKLATEAVATSTPAVPAATANTTEQANQEKTAIPLMDYVLNVMKFVESILSNNTTDDHCREFMNQKGLVPLMGILGLPNLPVDFPSSPSCSAVASVCKSILTLSQEPQILQQGLLHLHGVLETLEPLHRVVEPPGGSVLLQEFVNAPQGPPDPLTSAQATPILHGLSAAHAYISMFTNVCKVGQSDIRTMSINHWGSELGLQVLSELTRLYTSLVWESTVLLAFCSEDILPQGSEFGKAHLEKLVPKDLKDKAKGESPDQPTTISKSQGELGTNGVSHAMETLSTSDSLMPRVPGSPMDTDDTPTTSKSEGNSTISGSKKSKMSPVLQAQIKQIKPLLSASSRLGRMLAELFGLLVKLCVGSPVRQRRSQIVPAPSAPSPSAISVATALAKLLTYGLQWQPPECAPVPRLRLTFYICSVGFTAPMLFDEKKQPFHLMIQKFQSCGGQDAMFEAFRWALDSGGRAAKESDTVPETTGEFLDVWLMLLEKMVNVKNVLDSPNILPAKSSQPGYKPFNVVQYLIHTHKMAFEAVMCLWNKKPLKEYGSRMTESMLAILCHIIKGEPIIKEKLEKQREAEKEKETAAASASSSSGPSSAASSLEPAPAAAPPPAPAVNPEQLQQLTDMGFSVEHATEALLQSTSLEAATEYCLTHPPPAPAPAQPPPAQSSTTTAGVASGQGAVGVDSSTSGSSKEPPKEADVPVEEEAAQVEEEPLSVEVLDQFCERVVGGCMSLLDALPESVYRVCDLLAVVAARNGNRWRDDHLLTALVAEIAELCLTLIEAASECPGRNIKNPLESDLWVDQFAEKEEANKLATRLHLLSLLFEEMRMSCAECVEDSEILGLLVNLLYRTQQCLCVSVKKPTTPKWVGPLLLVLDLYEKISLASRRKSELEKIVGKSHQWKWFDDRTGRWCTYSVSNNKSIDDAYQAGETSIRFTAGRRRYTVYFHTMVQVNEETGNRRPIMLALPGKDEEEDKTASSSKKAKKSESSKEESKMETEEVEGRTMHGLMPDHVSTIISCAVGLLTVPVEPDALHALMRILLRLTRDHETAMQFARLGGTRSLLALRQDSGFQGFTSLATLIFRHILEDPATLRHTLEKVMRSATVGTGSSMSGVVQNSMGSKELHYVLRVLGPAACRDPDMFTSVITQSMRIALPPPAKRDEDEARLTLPTTPQLVKCVPNKNPVPPPGVTPLVREVVEELLNALVCKQLSTTNEKSEKTPASSSDKTDSVQPAAMELTGEEEMIVKCVNLETETAAAPEPLSNILTLASAEKKKVIEKMRPLLPKSAILRLLAELVRSYAGVAQVIAQHTFQEVGQHVCITDEMSALAFVLDWLLPSMVSWPESSPEHNQPADKDCSPLSRVLIATLAAANHCPDAQAILVTEIKAALQRATALVESAEKHNRLQALSSIIGIVIEACPSAPPTPSSNPLYKGQQPSPVNNMVKLLLKKGLVTDLARITYSLDLSSPNMAATVNSALKPLETLSRIVNQPQTNMMSKYSGKHHKHLGAAVAANTAASNNIVEESTSQPLVQEATEQQNTENTQREESVRASGEERDTEEGADVTIEDVTGNQEQQQGLEETQPHSTIEPDGAPTTEEVELEEVLDSLLNRRSSPRREGPGGAEENIMDSLEEAAANHGILLDAMNMMDDTNQHDSQMITQDISDDDGDDNTQDEDERDDEEVDEGDEDDVDDEDDEDDDIDEEDEGSDMEGEDDEDEEEFEPMGGMDAAFQQLAAADAAADDLYVQLEEMMPSSGSHVMFGGDTGGGMSRVLEARSHYAMPIFNDNMHDNEFIPGPTNVPPAPSTVMPSHPLLVRHAESHNLGGSSNTLAARVHRAASRQRGSYRYNPATQTLHLHYTSAVPASASGSSGAGGLRSANPPALLQRLLGPSAASDVLQLTNSMAGSGQARFHFITNDSNMRLLNNPDATSAEADAFDDFFQDSMLEGDGGSSVVASVPSALARWSEEARVLDGDSIHDGITVLKPRIVGELESIRDIELAERKEKRSKQAQEDAAKKGNKETSGASTTTTATSATAAAAASTLPDCAQAQSTLTPASSTVIQGRSTDSTSANPQDIANFADSIVDSIINDQLVDDSQPQPGAPAAPAVSAPSGVPVSASEASSSSTVNAPAQAPSSDVPPHPDEDNWLFPAVPPVAGSTFTPPNFPSRPLHPPNAPNAPSNLLYRGPLSAPPTTTEQQQTPRMNLEEQLSPMDTSTIPLPPQPPPSFDQPPVTQPHAAAAAQPPAAMPAESERPITPEQPSDITSSDAVTINSSSSTSNNSEEEPSMADMTEQHPGTTAAGAGAAGTRGTDPTAAATLDMMRSALTSISSTLNDLVASTATDPAAPRAIPGSASAPNASSTTATTAPTPVPAPAAASSSAAGSAAAASSRAGGSGGGQFGDMSLPDGVDPSFLAALPESIRQEVIAEQVRLQRIQQRAQEQQQQAAQLGVSEVSAEFLAALPPNIQEEVLAQQRAEQARMTAEQTASTTQPEQPVDPASFITSLPTSLRQQVLADMDDSMVAVLPPDLAVEANMLRRELEERHRRLMQERLFSQGAGPLSALLRQSGLASRLGTTRYTMRPPQPRRHWSLGNSARGGSGAMNSMGGVGSSSAIKLRGRHLLDYEALTCLLVLLFVDDSRLNTSRLHRVLRNLCYHAPTRAWIIRALLSILQKTGMQCKSRPATSTATSAFCDTSTSSASNTPTAAATGGSGESRPQSAWLSISLDAALGCRANVFQMQKGSGASHTGGKKTPANSTPASVTIHPQAAPIVCRHVLDTLISLAKSFPSHFLPQLAAAAGIKAKDLCIEQDVADKTKESAVPKTPTSSRVEATACRDVDFWELLVRLDGSVQGSKKGKSFQKQLHGAPTSDSGSSGSDGAVTFDSSPLAQLMNMLAHPVVRRSQQLTDRLLRLLGLVSIGLGTPSSSSSTASSQPQQQLPHFNRQTLEATAAAPTPQPAAAQSADTTASSTAATTTTTTAAASSARVTEVSSECDEGQTTAAAASRPADDTLALSETMDITTVPDEHLTSTPLPTADSASNTTLTGEVKQEESAVLEEQLQLAVEVLTSKSCSEEGLEDATNLLVQLSRANSATRDTVLKLMLAGATTIGQTVQAHIRQLLDELLVMSMAKDEKESPKEEEDDDAFPSSSAQKGVLHDRFGGGSVVVHAPTKVKVAGGGRELQLPSMALLTSKMSSQHFLLRILKVIIQLREAAKAAASQASKALKQQQQNPERDFSNIPDALALLDAETESIMELVGRHERAAAAVTATLATSFAATATSSSTQPTTATSAPTSAAATSAATTTTSASSSSQPQSTAQSTTQSTAQSTPMEVDQPALAAVASAASANAAAAAAAAAASAVSSALQAVGAAEEEQQAAGEAEDEGELTLPRLSEQLCLDELWSTLGECLTQLASTTDHHAVLVLQPAVEAFFMVHAGERLDKPSSSGGRGRAQAQDLDHLELTAPMSPAAVPASDSQMSLSRQDSTMSSAVHNAPQLPPDTAKFLKFAETHRTVLNQILRQSSTPLAAGPFSVLVDHTRILDFDVKRRYFRQELERIDEGTRREDLAVHVRREHVFEDSFRDIHRRSTEEWKHRFYIVFEGEEGQDAGGLLREWYLIMSREIFNPNYALFMISPGDRVTYTINPSSHCNSNHLSYFKFVGRFLAKAVYDNKLLECYFTRSFYKHILSKPVHYTDMESEDYAFYQGLVFLLEHQIKDLGYELSFSTEIQEFGKTEIRDLKPNGRNLHVSEETKKEYIKLVCVEKMTGAIKKQLHAFLEGFYDIIPKRLISIFNEQELELLISGLPTVDIDDLKSNTEYHKYQTTSLQIQWFWRALRTFEQADRAAFLQFVTGTSKVPLQGFAYLEGMNGIQKFQIHRDDRSTDRLPCAHTCFNQLDLPAYETYDKLRSMLLTAIHECSEGFGLA